MKIRRLTTRVETIADVVQAVGGPKLALLIAAATFLGALGADVDLLELAVLLANPFDDASGAGLPGARTFDLATSARCFQILIEGIGAS